MTRNLPSVELQLGKHLNWPSAACAVKIQPSSETAASMDHLTCRCPRRIIGKVLQKIDCCLRRPESRPGVRRASVIRRFAEMIADPLLSLFLDRGWSRANRRRGGDVSPPAPAWKMRLE